MSEAPNVCRGCLGSEGDMRNMFEHNIHEEFTIITNVQVYRCEGLSELLCAECRRALAVCREFIKRSRQSDDTLRKQMYSTEIEIKNSTDFELKKDLGKDETQCILEANKLTLLVTPKDVNSDTDGNMRCPFKCNNIFTKKNHLLNHMFKLHGVDKTNFSIATQYYCAYKNCKYNIDSKNKFFPLKKTLKNHIANVHTSEKIHCNVCQMSFAQKSSYERHKEMCDIKFVCPSCNIEYKTNERLMVHLMRRHPDLHKEYKTQRKQIKLQKKAEIIHNKKKNTNEDGPKRTLATQTFDIINDITLNSCSHNSQTSLSTNETQTVFEDLLRSEDEFETISLSDIQTQTWPVKKSNQTQTNAFLNTEYDLSFKETQTCFCFMESPNPSTSHFNFPKYIFDSANSSPSNLTSTETQTPEIRSRDVLLSFNSIETQTCQDYDMDDTKMSI